MGTVADAAKPLFYSLSKRPCAFIGFQTTEEIIMAETAKLGGALKN
jgi:hypothetical protein